MRPTCQHPGTPPYPPPPPPEFRDPPPPPPGSPVPKAGPWAAPVVISTVLLGHGRNSKSVIYPPAVPLPPTSINYPSPCVRAPCLLPVKQPPSSKDRSYEKPLHAMTPHNPGTPPYPPPLPPINGDQPTPWFGSLVPKAGPLAAPVVPSSVLPGHGGNSMSGNTYPLGLPVLPTPSDPPPCVCLPPVKKPPPEKQPTSVKQLTPAMQPSNFDERVVPTTSVDPPYSSGSSTPTDFPIWSRGSHGYIRGTRR